MATTDERDVREIATTYVREKPKKKSTMEVCVRESVVMTMIMRDAHATNLSNVIRQNNDGFFYDYTGQRRKAMEKQLQRLTISTTKTKRDKRMAERL